MFRLTTKYGCALAVFLLTTGVAAPRHAAAQGVDAAVGWSFVHDNTLSDLGVSGNMPKGIFASLGVGVGPWLSLVGEVSSNRKTFEDAGTDIELKVDFYGAGVRLNGRSGAARPYAQVLFGAARGRIAALGQSESGSEFAWQPGGGIDAYFSRNVGLRFGVNGRFIQAEGESANEFQVIVGLVFGGGR